MKQLSQILETNWKMSNDKGNIKPLEDKLKNHYKDYDEYDEGAIHDYTRSSEKTNKYLWNKHQDGSIKNVDHENMVKDLDNAVDKHRTPHKLSVYSGMKYDPRVKLNEKNELNHPAFLSTSLSQDEAHFFSDPVNNKNNGDSEKHILKINVPKNHPGAYVDHLSENKGEKEFILPRNTKLKYKGTVIHKKDDTNRDYDIHEHNMDII